MKAQEAKVEITPTVRKLAEERLKELTERIQDAEALQVKREDEARIARTELDKMKTEQIEISEFLQAH